MYNPRSFFGLITISLLLFSCSLVQRDSQAPDNGGQVPASEEPAAPENQLIGGQRDDYGCLGPAGYSYDKEIRACIRTWELDETARRAARLAIEHVRPAGGQTVLEVQSLLCSGCFIVKLERGQDRILVTIDNWEAVQKSMTPDECIALGGEPLNIVGGASCPKGTENAGEVAGFISPNVCCAPAK